MDKPEFDSKSFYKLAPISFTRALILLVVIAVLRMFIDLEDLVPLWWNDVLLWGVYLCFGIFGFLVLVIFFNAILPHRYYDLPDTLIVGLGVLAFMSIFVLAALSV